VRRKRDGPDVEEAGHPPCTFSPRVISEKNGAVVRKNAPYRRYPESLFHTPIADRPDEPHPAIRMMKRPPRATRHQ